MRIQGVHHVQVTVPTESEADARAFYLGVLGLTEIPKPTPLAGRGGFWAKAGTTDLHVGVEEGVDRRASKAHVAYQVDDLTAARNALRNAGVDVSESIPIPGYDRFEIRDPFGNRLEFIQAVPAGRGGNDDE